MAAIAIFAASDNCGNSTLVPSGNIGGAVVNDTDFLSRTTDRAKDQGG
jgi:hypothetical protein